VNPADISVEEPLLGDMPEQSVDDLLSTGAPAALPAKPRRDFTQMMRKIPVTLTLEVGSARISLQDLAAIEPNSVIELDALAGEPLVIRVNGTPIGRAEVVVSGENYGLKVIELNDLDFSSLTG
jgi:flagellar motor switch protein FliN/FliY